MSRKMKGTANNLNHDDLHEAAKARVLFQSCNLIRFLNLLSLTDFAAFFDRMFESNQRNEKRGEQPCR